MMIDPLSKVYIIVDSGWEWSRIVGIYTERSAAERFVISRDLQDEYDGASVTTTIEEHKVEDMRTAIISELNHRAWMVTVLENAIRYLDTEQARASRPLLEMFAAALFNAGMRPPSDSKENS